MKVRDFPPTLAYKFTLFGVAIRRRSSGVERVGLVASSFQFFSSLGSVFAEEVGDLLIFI